MGNVTTPTNATSHKVCVKAATVRHKKTMNPSGSHINLSVRARWSENETIDIFLLSLRIRQAVFLD
jgi:hypothetical protein